MHKKKILAIFSSSSGYNGAAINFLFIIKTLINNDFDIYCLCAKRDIVYKKLIELGVKTFYFPVPLTMNTNTIIESSEAGRLYVLGKNLKDIIRFTTGFFASLYLIFKTSPKYLYLMDSVFPQSLIAGIIMRKKIITEVQAQLIEGKYGIRRKLFIYLFNKSEKIFGITKIHIDPFTSKKSKCNYFVIPNSYEIPKINQDFLATLQFDLIKKDSSKYIIYLGGMDPNKGSLFLMDIIHEFRKDHNYKWLIFGNYNKNFHTRHSSGNTNLYFTETNLWLKYIETEQYEEKIIFLGNRENVADYMVNCSLLLVPHRFPHFSRPIVEAFALKVPVLATEDDFNRDLISNGYNGLLAKYGDIENWVKNINKILNDNKLSNSITKNAFESYIKDFHPTIIKSKILKCFN